MMKEKTYKFLFAVIVIIILGVIPLFSGRFMITMLIRIMYFSMMAVGFSFLAGQLGLFSLMVPVSFAISGYTVAILESKGILFFPSSALLGVLFAVLASAFFGLLVNRSKGTYFLMLTLVLGQIIWALALQWVSLTKGTNGISGITTPILLGGGHGNSNIIFYYAITTVFILIIVLLNAVVNSPYGMMLRGIRESESRMKMLGYNVAYLKWTAFMIGSFIASVSGIFFVYYTSLMNPDSINLNASTQILIASIFGGTSGFAGAIIGTVIIKTLEIVLSGFTQRYLLIIGVLFLLIIIFIPQGMMGIVRKGISVMGNRRRK